MLRFKLLYCLLFCLHYGLSGGSCATQAMFPFVHARTAVSMVTCAQPDIHYKLLVLLHGAATCLAVPHPAFLQLMLSLTLHLCFGSIPLFQNIFPVCQDHFWTLILFPSIATALPGTIKFSKRALCVIIHITGENLWWHCMKRCLIPLIKLSISTADGWELLLRTAVQSVLQLSPGLDFIEVSRESNPHLNQLKSPFSYFSFIKEGSQILPTSAVPTELLLSLTHPFLTPWMFGNGRRCGPKEGGGAGGRRGRARLSGCPPVPAGAARGAARGGACPARGERGRAGGGRPPPGVSMTTRRRLCCQGGGAGGCAPGFQLAAANSHRLHRPPPI